MRTNPTYFIDRIRVLLTGLVVFHHTAIVYGAIGGWYWREVDPSAPMDLTRLLLIEFCTVNQAYFMGFFFLLAGYFAPPSYDRKGGRRFLRERLIRLGLPLLVYMFLLHQITVALAMTAEGKPFLRSLIYLWSHREFGNGPLWFTQTLLIFALVYALWRQLRPDSTVSEEPSPIPGPVPLVLSVLGVGAVAFLLRLMMPVGTDISGMQLGYFASYIFLFAVGCLAWRGRWLERIEGHMAKPWLVVSALAIPILPIVLLCFHPPMDQISGGWNPWAALYAIWEPLVAWGIILGMLWQFRLRANRANVTMDWLAERTYAVYIIHPPILVGISLMMRFLIAPPLLKFMATGTLACLGCVLVATLLLRIPGIKKVL